MTPAEFFVLSNDTDPRSQPFPPRVAEQADAGDSIDFDTILAEARRIRRCAECGVDLDHRTVPRSAFL